MLTVILIVAYAFVVVYAFGQARFNLQRARDAEAKVKGLRDMVANLDEANQAKGKMLEAKNAEIVKLVTQVRQMSQR